MTVDEVGVLSGGGEMGARMRSLDWGKTSLGPVHQWPQSLKTSVSTCLNSRFAILIWWGKDLVKIYNDAYAPILGRKHPRALGAPGKEVWPEIWHIIGPMLEGVMQRGEATWSDDLLLELESNGYPEERYFTFSYSPIRDESGGIGGVFTPVQETTHQVIGARRLRTLRDLAEGARAANARSSEEVCRKAAQTLSMNTFDAPFAAFYLFSKDGKEARLAGASGFSPAQAVAPETVRADEGWVFGRAAFSGRTQVVALPETLEGGAAGSVAGPPPRQGDGAAGGAVRTAGGVSDCGGEPAQATGRRLPEFFRADRAARKHGAGGGDGARRGAAAGRGAGGDRPREDGVFFERQPRVPYAADDHAGAARTDAERGSEPRAGAPQASGDRAPEQLAAAAAGEFTARLFAHRGGAHQSLLCAGGSRGADGGPVVELPLGDGDSGPPVHGGLPGAAAAGVRGWRDVGADRAEPAVERVQIHARGAGVGGRSKRWERARALTVADTGTGIPESELPHIFRAIPPGGRREGANV